MKKSGFSSRQASIWANSGLRKIKAQNKDQRIRYWECSIWWNPFVCPSVRFLICVFCPWSVPRTKQDSSIVCSLSVCHCLNFVLSIEPLKLHARTSQVTVEASLFSLILPLTRESKHKLSNRWITQISNPTDNLNFGRFWCFSGSTHWYRHKHMGCSILWVNFDQS